MKYTALKDWILILREMIGKTERSNTVSRKKHIMS